LEGPVAGGGSEAGNALVKGRLFFKDGSPAPNAYVEFVPVDFKPGPIVQKALGNPISITTNKNGEFSVANVPTGTYNMLGRSADETKYSLSDSVVIGDSGGDEGLQDTLDIPGSIAGVVRLHENHSSRRVFVLVMGTNGFTIPSDSIGNFTISNLAAGTYRIHIFTTLDAYVPLDTHFTVLTGLNDTLSDTIRLSGFLPPENLTATFDTVTGKVNLNWRSYPFIGSAGVLVYINPINLAEPFKISGPTPISGEAFVHNLLVKNSTYAPGDYVYRLKSQDQNANQSEFSKSAQIRAVSKTQVATAFQFSLDGTINGEASIYDSVTIQVDYSNPTRKNHLIEWAIGNPDSVVLTIKDSSKNGTAILKSAWNTAGQKTVYVKATDDGGSVWIDSIAFTIHQDAPVISIGNDTTVSINDSFYVSASGTDRFGRITKFRFDLFADGSFDDSLTDPGRVAFLAPENPGEVLIRVQAEDDDANKTQDTLKVTVILDPPTVDAGPDTNLHYGTLLNLHGLASDEFGRIVKYEWDFDGPGNNYPYLELSSGDTSLYLNEDVSIFFRVTDDDGNIAKDTILVKIFPREVKVSIDPDSIWGKSFRVKWNKSSEKDFKNYLVYYSESEGVSSSSILASKISDLDFNQILLKGLNPNTTYYLKVYVEDSTKLTTSSNEISVNTKQIWVEKMKIPIKVEGHGAVHLKGKIYVMGGTDLKNVLVGFRHTYIFDPALNQWTGGPYLVTARKNLTASAINEKIFVMGGYNYADSKGPLNRVEHFDLTLNQWIRKSPMLSPRENPISVVYGSKIFVLGGKPANNKIDQYDPLSDQWTEFASMPVTRERFAAVSLNKKIIIMGGNPIANWVQEFDPISKTWATKGNMPEPRLDFTASIWKNQVFIFGELDKKLKRINSVYSYDPVKDAWEKKTSIPIKISLLRSVTLNKKIYIIGGGIGTGHVETTNRVFEYNPDYDR